MTYRLQLVSTAAVIALMAAPAFAQSEGNTATPGATQPAEATAEGIPPATNTPASAAPEAEQSGDILVTARRRSENISKVPISITALSGESLKQRQVTSEIDLQTSVPGLTIRQSGSSNQFNYALRGQSVDTYSGSPPSVLPYINDVQIVQHSASTFYDLEGIQVLKGPQGTLFGRNSTGGAILFQTAKPTDKFGGYLIARYGNHDSKYVEGAVSVPISDKIALRVAGNYNGGGAHVKNVLTDKWLGKKDSKSIRGTLVIKPVDGLTNTTVVQHTWEGGNNIPTELYSAYPCGGPPVNGFTLNATADCAYGPGNPAFNTFIANHPKLAPYAAGVDSFAELQRKWGPWKAAIETPLFHKAKSTFVINTTNYELSPSLTLKNIVGFNRSKADDGFDYDGTPYPIFTTGGTLSADGTTLLNPTGFDQWTHQFSEEFQIQGKAFDNRLTWVVGAFMLNQSYNILSNLKGFDGIAAPTNFAYSVRQKTRSRALFAQATYKVTDQLSLTGGIRYSWEKASQRQNPQSAYFLGGFGAASQSQKASKPSWTVSADYQINPTLLVYIANRGSWRTGGYNYSTPPFDTTADEGGDVFNPETTKDVEIGLKYNGRDAGVPITFNIAAYNQWINNAQRAAYVPGFNGPGLVTVNVPKAKITGVEADLSVRPSRWLTIGISGAYTNARYTSNKVVLIDPTSPNPFPGNQFTTRYGPFADTPKFTGSVYFDVSHELAGDAGILTFHADIYAQSKFSFSNVGDTVAPETYLKGYALVNSRLSWNNMLGTKISSAFYIRNLFNKKYYTGGNSTGPTLGTNTSVGGMPRMFGGELRFDF